MAKIGITRRIDSLGRVVIPKDIRRNLHFNDSDELEISVVDNQVVLTKCDSLETNTVIDSLAYILYHQIKKNILITSKEKIVNAYLVDRHNYVDIVLSDYALNLIKKRKYVYNSISKVNLFNREEEISYVVSPFLANGDLIGSIIVFGDDDFTKEELKLIGFSTRFLEKYLEQ